MRIWPDPAVWAVYCSPVAFKTSELHSSEQIVLDMHPHPIVLFKSVLALVVSVLFGLWVVFWWQPEGNAWAVFKVVVAVLIVGALIYFLVEWVNFMSEQFVVTTDRCIFRQGILKRSGVEIPLERINTVFFEQNVLERMVGCGSLALESAGERGTEKFSHVRNPVKVQNAIYQQIEENENRKFDRISANAAAAVTSTASTADEIAKLASLLEQGHITQAEFDTQKATLLRGER